MSFDKVKAMRNAERYISQGKIRAAIGEYKKIVENDPKDYSTLNVLGDLFIKNSEQEEAVSCYTKVAEHFSKQGFAQKAIAIYNKISRIQPNSADVSAKLAKLYQMKGSFAEARSHYVALAEQYQRKGQKTEALEIWKQIAELDPNNTEVYLKIAEFCLQDGNKDEAAKAFTEAGIRFSSRSQLEPALSAFSNALEIKQYDLTALNGFVSVQVKLGYAEDAARFLDEILEKNPYNRDILYLLVDCHIDAGNAVEAEKTVIRLVEQEPANYPKFLQLVELYVKHDNLDSATRILSMSSEHLLVGGKSEDFLKWTNEILAKNPEQLDALRLLVRYYGWQRDETELKKSLERLAEIARLQDSVDDERYALSQLVMILPHEVAYAKRLQEINYQSGETMPSGEEYALSAPVTEEREIPTFEGLEPLNQENADDAESEQLAEYEQYETQYAAEELTEAFIYSEPYTQEIAEGEVAEDFSNPDEFLAAEAFEVKPISGELSLSEQRRLEQELEGVQFYLAQGYTDLAEKTLDILESEFGERFEIIALRANQSPIIEKLEEISVAPPEIFVQIETPQPKFKEIQPAQTFDLMDDFRSELGFEDVAPADDGDYETHYHLAIAYKEMGLMEESIREFQDAINMVRADDGTRRFFQCCNLLGHCFIEQGMPNLALLWYRRALETPDLSDDERQAVLYETANAYEIGGEAPKAVEYFEQVYAVNVDYRDVISRLESLREHQFAM